MQPFEILTLEWPQWVDKRDKPLNRAYASLSPDSGTGMCIDLSAANLGCRPQAATFDGEFPPLFGK